MGGPCSGQKYMCLPCQVQRTEMCVAASSSMHARWNVYERQRMEQVILAEVGLLLRQGQPQLCSAGQEGRRHVIICPSKAWLRPPACILSLLGTPAGRAIPIDSTLQFVCTVNTSYETSNCMRCFLGLNIVRRNWSAVQELHGMRQIHWQVPDRSDRETACRYH